MELEDVLVNFGFQAPILFVDAVSDWRVTAQGQRDTVHIILSPALGQLEKFP